MNRTSWNDLADIFDTQNETCKHPSAMDNVLIAWPAVIDILDSYLFQNNVKSRKSVLDFGCGTGGFTIELSKRGYIALGIDPAPRMIEIANQRSNGVTQFICGDCCCLEQSYSCDAVISIMAFQFIDKYQETIRALVSHLAQDGLFLLAVHNPAYVDACLSAGFKFHRDSAGECWISFRDNISLRIYIRDLTRYESAMREVGLSRYHLCEPPFTDEYIRLYGLLTKEPVHIPKYLIMAFRKS